TLFEHDLFTSFKSLSPFVEDIVTHISGFIVRKLLKTIKCDVCTTFLICSNAVSNLTGIKNRGSLVFPTEDVIQISRSAECIIRENNHIIFTKQNINKFLTKKVFHIVHDKVFIHTNIISHILEKDNGDHKVKLIKAITSTYIQLRLFH
ncbi:hypothetical protein EAG_02319, partial [Camponotus floridanus]